MNQIRKNLIILLLIAEIVLSVGIGFWMFLRAVFPVNDMIYAKIAPVNYWAIALRHTIEGVMAGLIMAAIILLINWFLRTRLVPVKWWFALVLAGVVVLGGFLGSILFLLIRPAL